MEFVPLFIQRVCGKLIELHNSLLPLHYGVPRRIRRFRESITELVV